MQLNASRIKVLQAQDDEAASKELLHVSQDHQLYKKLLKDLTVQSLLRLKEQSVLLRCRKADQDLVEGVLDSAKEEYAKKANVHPPEIFVNDQVYLPPAPTYHNAHGPFCCGGIVMASRDGKIVCENTLDARLDVVFRKKLPQVWWFPLPFLQFLTTNFLFLVFQLQEILHYRKTNNYWNTLTMPF